MPQHVSFAPGQTIAADGKAGVFFLDPYTGVANGWVVPEPPDASGRPSQLPLAFTLGGTSTDASHFVYTCETESASGAIPCGGAKHDNWYLFDTATGVRTRLGAFSGDHVSISPGGRTLIGDSGGNVVVASVDAPADVRALNLPAGDQLAGAMWSPDSEHAVVLVGAPMHPLRQAFLASVPDGSVRALPLAGAQMAWSGDGSRLALAADGWDTTGPNRLSVLDEDGDVLWSRSINTFSPNPRWTADGSMLAVDVFESTPTAEAAPAERLDIFDGATGAALYRITGVAACSGPVWVGASAKLIVGPYATGGSVLVDLTAESTRGLGTYVMPVPYSDEAGITMDAQENFETVDLRTGATKLIGKLGELPSFDAFGGEMFLGDNIAFTFPVQGHDGCGIGDAPAVMPSFAVLHAPFADDAGAMRPGSVADAARACGSTSSVDVDQNEAVRVNADGDSVDDRLLVEQASAASDTTFGIDLVLDGTRVVSVAAPLMNAPVAAIGGYDVDGDGRDELFVKTGEGAYTQYVDVYEFDPGSCQLVRLSGEPPVRSGTPVPPIVAPQFTVGASAQNAGALACADGLLFGSTTGAPEGDPESNFEERRISYAIDGDHLRFVEDDHYGGLQPPGSWLDCGALELPK